MLQKILYSLVLIFGNSALFGQNILQGKVLLEDLPIQGVAIEVLGSDFGTTSNGEGFFEIILPKAGVYKVRASFIGCQSQTQQVEVQPGKTSLVFNLREVKTSLDEVVVSGTMKAVSRSESPVPV